MNTALHELVFLDIGADAVFTESLLLVLAVQAFAKPDATAESPAQELVYLIVTPRSIITAADAKRDTWHSRSVMGFEHIADTAIEALDHSVGLRGSGFGQAVLDAECLAPLVELVIAAGLALARGEQAAGELLAVVGQQLGDLDRAGLVQFLQ